MALVHREAKTGQHRHARQSAKPDARKENEEDGECGDSKLCEYNWSCGNKRLLARPLQLSMRRIQAHDPAFSSAHTMIRFRMDGLTEATVVKD